MRSTVDFAAARRSDEDEQLAIGDFEAEIARGDVAVRVDLVDVLQVIRPCVRFSHLSHSVTYCILTR